MSGFLTKLHTVSLPGRKAGAKCLQLTRPLSYLNRDSVVVTAPAGYETDGASVPRAVWWLLPPFGSYREAAVIHDYLFEVQKVGGKRIGVTEANMHLLWGMEDLGVSWWKRQAIYRAVQVGGWVSFRKYTKRLK